MQFNKKELKVLAAILTVWAIIMITTGTVMNSKIKPIIHTKYSVNISKKKVSVAQAKTNEIKLKDIKLEINTPLSVDIKDYLENVDNIDETTLKSLKLDTSLVNINEAGTYHFTISYKKKKYLGTIIIKEKELPNMSFTLKTIEIKTGESLSSNPRTFIKEEITDEVYNNITLNIGSVDTTTQGDYTYYITYKGMTYQGKVEVRDPQPTIITPASACPEDADKIENGCKCKDESKTYDSTTKTCKKLNTTEQES